MSDIVEQAARVLKQTTDDGANKTEDYAQALADAGLLATLARLRGAWDHGYSAGYADGCAQAWGEAAQLLAGEYDDPNAAQYLHDTNPYR